MQLVLPNVQQMRSANIGMITGHVRNTNLQPEKSEPGCIEGGSSTVPPATLVQEMIETNVMPNALTIKKSTQILTATGP